jgi:hypothetical protein
MYTSLTTMAIDKLSLAQEASLLAGKDLWHTQAIPSHNIPSLRVRIPSPSLPLANHPNHLKTQLSDGPNGVRG